MGEIKDLGLAKQIYTTDLELWVSELQEEIEALKCCGNCTWWNIDNGYPRCNEQSANTIIPSAVVNRRDKCDKWQQQDPA